MPDTAVWPDTGSEAPFKHSNTQTLHGCMVAQASRQRVSSKSTQRLSRMLAGTSGSLVGNPRHQSAGTSGSLAGNLRHQSAGTSGSLAGNLRHQSAGTSRSLAVNLRHQFQPRAPARGDTVESAKGGGVRKSAASGHPPCLLDRAPPVPVVCNKHAAGLAFMQPLACCASAFMQPLACYASAFTAAATAAAAPTAAAAASVVATAAALAAPCGSLCRRRLHICAAAACRHVYQATAAANRKRDPGRRCGTAAIDAQRPQQWRTGGQRPQRDVTKPGAERGVQRGQATHPAAFQKCGDAVVGDAGCGMWGGGADVVRRWKRRCKMSSAARHLQAALCCWRCRVWGREVGG